MTNEEFAAAMRDAFIKMVEARPTPTETTRRCHAEQMFATPDRCQEPGCTERPTYGIRITDHIAILRCAAHAGPMERPEFRRRERGS